ncbi:MAG: beta-ketoacyl synthase N-terminal-like domain-containing protein [Candidatus Omnitrophica bacterium]|nr:beta-ketoacyl synthase N-terminal-like domain-containing protein [Candidatus Omnitrophota bacterium]
MDKRPRVVITGIGPITSLGIGKNTLWAGLLKGKPHITTVKTTVDNTTWDTYHCHTVPNFNISHFGINQDELDFIKDWKEGDETIDLFYLFAAIKLALDDSGIQYDNDSNGLGMIVMHENMNLLPLIFKMSTRAFDILSNKSSNLTKIQFFSKLYEDCLKSGYDAQTFMTLFHAARVFKIHEESLVINNACASGLYALETASQMIKTSQNKMVVVAASDVSDIYKYLWFKNLGIYAPDGIIKPFCSNSDGLVFGDGSIGIVVEELNHALKRKAPIYAEYIGGGFSLESWRVTMPKINSTSYQDAIKKALKHASLASSDIELLCPHGVGSHVTDLYESKAITDIFGKNSKSPLITTFKPYIGHNLGGSTLLETAILLLSMSNNKILPTLNYHLPDARTNIYLVDTLIDQKITTTMKICCAFAGYNAAAIFRRLS